MDYLEFIYQREKEFNQHRLHEISNKFSLLSLSLEDIADTLEEVGDDLISLKEGLLKELSQADQFREKFLKYLSAQKEVTDIKDGPLSSPREIFDLVLKMKMKEINKEGFHFEYGGTTEEMNFLALCTLFWNMISLRLFQKEERNFTLKFESSSSFLEEEIRLVEGINHGKGEQFNNSYIKEMRYLLTFLD